jgi:hypothetical protein
MPLGTVAFQSISLPSASRKTPGWKLAGATSRWSMAITRLSLADQMSMKPPPPMPQLNGSVTPSVAAAATAASMALPPASRICIAARLASCEMVATAPPWPVSTGCFASAPKAAIMAAVARRVRVVLMMRSVGVGT